MFLIQGKSEVWNMEVGICAWTKGAIFTFCLAISVDNTSRY